MTRGGRWYGLVVAGMLVLAGATTLAGAGCHGMATAGVAVRDGEHRPRNLSRRARRARVVREVDLGEGGRLILRATRDVPPGAVDWTEERFSRGFVELRRLLGPAPVDLEIYLVGLEEFPPSYYMTVRRRKRVPWATVGILGFTVPQPGKPSWDQVRGEFHEQVHHWLDHGDWYGGHGYPRWLEEGVADVVSVEVVRALGGPAPDRPVPAPQAWERARDDLLGWGEAGGLREVLGTEYGEALAGVTLYDLAYHVVREVWDRDGGRTVVRLLRAFGGREEVPSREEQERIFAEVVGEPLAAVIERAAARAESAPPTPPPAGAQPAVPAGGR